MVHLVASSSTSSSSFLMVLLSFFMMAAIALPVSVAAFLARTGSAGAVVSRSTSTSAAAALPYYYYLLTTSTAATTTKTNLRRLSLLRAGATAQDTPTTLPDFASKDDYLKFMEPLSGLPKGFATGTANGKFISKEAPAMGPLPIRGTVIYLADGPTNAWAAVFTKNKVRKRGTTQGLDRVRPYRHVPRINISSYSVFIILLVPSSIQTKYIHK